MDLKAKQVIKMPGRNGAVLPKGQPFIWNPRTQHYVAKQYGQIVASVSADYVSKVNIFEV